MYLPQVTDAPFRILIVEDDPSVMRLAALQFKAAGIDIFVARDGIEAWDQLAQVDPHMVVTDVKMPRLSGHALVGRIRQVSVIPILIMTAEVSDEAQVQSFKMGADGYITKPFTPQLLTMRVVSILRRVYSYNNGRVGRITSQNAPSFDSQASGGLPAGFVRCDSCGYVGPTWKFEKRDAQDNLIVSCPSCRNTNISFALA
ncbi:response regulator [bacterium]|nr:MAG: response regulator [bacterium]